MSLLLCLPIVVCGLLCSMINERRILMISETLGRLTACVHSAAALIYPMHWSVCCLVFVLLINFASLTCSVANREMLVQLLISVWSKILTMV